MRKSLKKLKARVINYRSYKHFSNEVFRENLLAKLSQQTFVNNDYGFKEFCNITLKTLDKYALRKTKHARGNQMPFVTEDLSKNIMKRSRLRNKYLKSNNEENRKLYDKQRNYCVSLLRKTKKAYYENLDDRNVSDNKLFWKTVKLSLSEKFSARERISLSENSKIVKTEKQTAEVFNNFFGNIGKNFNIPQYSDFDPVIEKVKDPTLKAILTYEKHPSILAIRTKCNRNGAFSFKEVSFKEIEIEIRLLKLNKASQYSDIPTKFIIENSDIFSSFICESINNSKKSSIFPSCLKHADVTPLYKKCNKSLKGNYRPVSILPISSKVFERSMLKQMSSFFDDIFSKYQHGFRKGFSTQQCLLALLEKWKKSIDRGKVFGALLTDLSKACDCLNHDFLIAKLNAYGFSLPALRLIHDHLSNRNQRTRINNSYSTWMEIVFGVPQVSTLGPLLFNIFLADLFFIVNSTDIANYTDDNTPYATGNDIGSLITSLEEASKSLFTWFDNNLMKINADKRNLLVSSNEKVTIKIGSYEIANTKRDKLLGVHLDSGLSFDYHISEICKKTSHKVCALASVTSGMSLSKKRTLMNAFFNSQFNYCPLIWMCHSRENNNKINSLHKRY